MNLKVQLRYSNLRNFKSSVNVSERPPSFKFWIVHFTTFCLCLHPESNSPLEGFFSEEALWD